MRYFEFQDFERKFEECISKSAVQTKFQQHSLRGKHIAGDTKSIMDKVFMSSQNLRSQKTMLRKELWDKIDFTDKQLQLLTHEMKDKIRQMVEDVECKVSKALSEEIRRLGVLVDEFHAPFHPDLLVLNVYKKELHSHCESGLGSNLRARLSTALAMNMENSQKEMTERMSALLPPDKRNINAGFMPRREPFEVLYRLNCDNLCGDFHEDISFKFSFGINALMKRYFGGGYFASRSKLIQEQVSWQSARVGKNTFSFAKINCSFARFDWFFLNSLLEVYPSLYHHLPHHKKSVHSSRMAMMIGRLYLR